MGNSVFPALAGLSWDIMKTPQHSTLVQQSAGGKEVRTAFYSTPIWKWTMKYEVLRQAAANLELQQLIGFFNARQGRFDSFLFSDPNDNAVVGQNFGTGTGSATAFQLVRDYGASGFTGRENVYDINNSPSAPIIKVNGVTKTVTTDYTIGATGIVTFTVAPAAAAALTWDGFYYWRVRFDQDSAEFNNFMYQLWNLQQLIFVSVK